MTTNRIEPLSLREQVLDHRRTLEAQLQTALIQAANQFLTETGFAIERVEATFLSHHHWGLRAADKVVLADLKIDFDW